jgi:hypothetical protein
LKGRIEVLYPLGAACVFAGMVWMDVGSFASTDVITHGFMDAQDVVFSS